MPKRIVLCSILATALSILAAHAETWDSVPLVDAMCYAKAKADPDRHTTACALTCSKSGYGIITPDGTFLRFDESGNARAAALLRGTERKDHLRVTVDAERNGETLKVKSLSLN